MSKYSEFLKQRKESEMDFFFGEDNWKKTSNKYFTFKRILNEDEIIIVTNNIREFKNGYVLIVANNKVVYLKDWQFKRVHNYNFFIDCFVVKLNRKFFKPYTLSFNLDDISIETEDTFDELFKVAKEQEEANVAFALGWMNY